MQAIHIGRRDFFQTIAYAITTAAFGAGRLAWGSIVRPAGATDIVIESGSLQVFEDHDTRGDPRYPPVKQPRDVPRSIEEWRRRHNR